MDAETISTLIKTGLFGIAAYIGGLLTEPIKKILQNRIDRQRLRNALYSELSGNIANFLPYISNLKFPEDYPFLPLNQWLKKDVYQEGLKQPIQFREIHESRAITDFYMCFDLLASKSTREQIEMVENLNRWVASAIHRGLLSRRKLNKYWGSTLPSPFRHPIVSKLDKLYWKLIFRNSPKGDGKTYVFKSTDTLLKKIRALLAGTPGITYTPQPSEPPQPNAPQTPTRLRS